MGFLDAYKARVNQFGSNEKDRITNLAAMDFKNFLNESPTTETITIGTDTYDIAIYTDSESISELEKMFLAETTTPLTVGTVCTWREKQWLIVIDESKVIKSYLKVVARQCNDKLRMYDVNNNIVDIDAHVIADGGSINNSKLMKYFSFSFPLGSIMAIIPKNALTNTIKLNDRFIVAGNPWEVEFVNDIDSENLLFITLTEELINKNIDNLTGGIVEKDIHVDTNTTVGNNKYVVIGQDELIWGETVTYSVKKYINDVESSSVFNFYLYDGSCGVITNVTSTTVTIKASDKTGAIKLGVIETGNEIITKDIRVINFMG